MHHFGNQIKVGPAFGVVGGLKDESREKQCAAFHKKAIEGLKGSITFSVKSKFKLTCLILKIFFSELAKSGKTFEAF